MKVHDSIENEELQSITDLYKQTVTSYKESVAAYESRKEAAVLETKERTTRERSDSTDSEGEGARRVPTDGDPPQKPLFGETGSILGNDWEADKTALAKELALIRAQLDDMGQRLIDVGGTANSIPGSQLLFLCLKCINDCATSEISIGQQATEQLLNSLIQFLAVTQSRSTNAPTRLPGGENIFEQVLHNRSQGRSGTVKSKAAVTQQQMKLGSKRTIKQERDDSTLHNFRMPEYKRNTRCVTVFCRSADPHN